MQTVADIFKARQAKKPPAHEWQDLALRIIQELNIPNFKRGSVFKVCKENSKTRIERCLNDTKELCKNKEKWQYFFKVVSSKPENLSPQQQTETTTTHTT